MSKVQSIQSKLGAIYIGRQPIYDDNLDVYAYELLFRDGDAKNTAELDGDAATNSIILNTLAELGIEEVVGNKLAFINLTKNLILNLPPIPKENFVLEILEDVAISQELIEATDKLVGQGYTIALDDFEFSEKWIPLIKLSKIIKIDILALSKQQLHKHVEILRPYKVKLLAEKVETHEEFNLCKDLGFQYFQGFFLSKPKIIKGKSASTNKLVVMQLLAKLNDPKTPLHDIESTLSEDPKITYKLLKIINCAAFAKVKKIESLHQAIVYLGMQKLKEWGTLLAISSIDSKPHDLMVITMVRAKMCELLASKSGKEDPDAYFTTGMFSTLPALLDEDMELLLNKLPLSEDIKLALIKQEGSMGKVLKNVIFYEQAKWNELNSQDYNPTQYSKAYFSSIDWASEASRALAN